MGRTKSIKKDRPLKILSIPVDKGGCGWYRVRQPLQAINEYSDSEAHVIDKEVDDPTNILQALCMADILVVRQGGEGGVIPLKDAANEYAKEVGLEKGFHAKTVLDIDDNIELISPYSEHYQEYGLKEFYDRNAKSWLWKDGKDFDLVRNRYRILNLLLGLRQADLVTVTTEKLAEYARQYNNNVAILPNVINTDHWWQLPLVHDPKQLRIGWSGGHSHYEDWYSIKEPLNRLMRKYRFKLVFAGVGFAGIVDSDLRDLVEERQWVPFEAHSYRMMALNLDIAIIPLSDVPFNHYKSPIKWFEFSSIGVPSVVANVTPYKEAISTETAMPYSSPEEFYTNLETLICSENRRKELAEKARKNVLSTWTVRQHVSTYLDAYRGIL